MTEPDVALTDFALALESGVFAAVLWRSRGLTGGRVPWLLLYFAMAGVASLCGGLVHGFFLDQNTMGNAILWPTTLLAIGLNAVAAFVIGAQLLFLPSVVRIISIVAGLAFAAYAGVVLMGADLFRAAVWMAAPATLFLFCALLFEAWRGRRPGAIFAAAGLALTAAAILVQQRGIGIHPRYFNHNAAAHCVQAVALALFFAGSLRLLGRTSTEPTERESCAHDANS